MAMGKINIWSGERLIRTLFEEVHEHGTKHHLERCFKFKFRLKVDGNVTWSGVSKGDEREHHLERGFKGR